MEATQQKLLFALIKNIRAEKKDKAKSLLMLQTAGILNKDGSFTKPYSDLAKIVTVK